MAHFMRGEALGILVFLIGVPLVLVLLYHPPPAQQVPSSPPAISEAQSVAPSPSATTNDAPAVAVEPQQKGTNEVAMVEAPGLTKPEETVEEAMAVPKGEIPPSVPPADGKPKVVLPHVPVIRFGADTSKRIALTFDDGPHPKFTVKVLDVLRERKVKATFFVLGSQVKRYPKILRQIADEGHEIGNHSFSHKFFTAISNDLISREIADTQNEIKSVLGYAPVLFRPPYGAFRQDTKTVFHEQNLKIILWSVDTKDWRVRNRDKIIHSVTNNTRSGSIILCHDIHKATLDALPEILDRLMSEGYQFQTVTELCGPAIATATVSTQPLPPAVTNN
jgi:peptidoglycan-N-acetylglucosamine deacetylase